MPGKKWLRRVVLFPFMVLMGGIPEGEGAASAGEPAQGPTAAETEARAKGWRPLEEYSGDKSKWVPADEFLARAPFYHEIGDLKRTIKKMDKALEATVKYTKQQTEAAYQRGLQDAHSRLDAAVEAGDKNAVREINKEIVALEQQKPADAPAAEEIPEEVVDFQSRNEWFDKDKTMTRVAIALAQQFAEDHPRTPLARRLEMVEEELVKMFPAKFTSRREAPAAVEGASVPAAGQGAKGKYSLSKLNAEEKMAHDQYVKRGVMTSEQYFKSLEDIEPGRFGK